MSNETRPRKAEWAALYSDGSEKITVAIDVTSDRLPDRINVEMGSNWLYIDAADVPWLCARLLDAAGIINAELAKGGEA